MSLPSKSPNPFADGPQLNPYAAPQYPAEQVPVGTGNFAGLWRQGDVLIMHKLAPLPPICLKSNEPSTQWLKRNLQWHPQWVLFLILLNVLICAIVALILTKRATINIGLTDEWMAKRKSRLMITWTAGLLGLALIAVGIITLATGSTPISDTEGAIAGLSFLGGIVLGLGALIGAQYGCRLIYASKMTDTHIWIKGVHPGFLDRLEMWYG